jgi:hypothetical protein
MNATLWPVSAEAKDNIARQNTQENIIYLILLSRQNVRSETRRVDIPLTGHATKRMKEHEATLA